MGDGFEYMTPEQISRMCNENLEELRQMHIERNQSWQWRPVEYVCKSCGNVGCVEVPHVSYELGVMDELPGFGVLAVFEDHAERFPECECPRLEYQKWK
jgi:acetone carboxylase gamma subunit